MFTPQQGAGSYLPESMLQPNIQQPAGYPNPTGNTAYQPDFSKFYNPESMLSSPPQPSFMGNMFLPSGGDNTQEPDQGWQDTIAMENLRNNIGNAFRGALGSNK